MNKLGDQDGMAPVAAFTVAGDLAAASLLAPVDPAILADPAIASKPLGRPIDQPQRIDPRWWLLALALGAVLWTILLGST